LTQYKCKFESLSLADPLGIKTGWVGEKSGIKSWPKVYFMDISRYYKNVISKENLWQRVECTKREKPIVTLQMASLENLHQSNRL